MKTPKGGAPQNEIAGISAKTGSVLFAERMKEGKRKEKEGQEEKQVKSQRERQVLVE